MATIGIINLNFNVERIYSVEGFATGKVFRVDRSVVQPGGKGVNVARVFETLGQPFEIAGCLGGSTGTWITRHVRALGFALRPFTIRGESRTCCVVSDPRGSRDTVINEAGPFLSRTEVLRLKKHISAFVFGKTAVVFSGSVPQGVTPRDYRSMVSAARRQGSITAVDICGKYLTRAIEAAPDVIKPNWQEWEEAAGRTITTLEDLKKTVAPVLGKGVRWVIITRGRRGAFYFHRDGIWDVRPPALTSIIPL